MVHTLADIAGNNQAQKLSSTRIQANWIQFTIPVTQSTGVSMNASAVRVGDQNVSSSRGTSVPTTGMLFPPISEGQYLDLSLVYVFVATGDKVQITYGVL